MTPQLFLVKDGVILPGTPGVPSHRGGMALGVCSHVGMLLVDDVGDCPPCHILLIYPTKSNRLYRLTYISECRCLIMI